MGLTCCICTVRWKTRQGMSQVCTELDQDPVPHRLLRKYIAYARTHVHPVLSSEAKQVWRAPPAPLFRQECAVTAAEQAKPTALMRGACGDGLGCYTALEPCQYLYSKFAPDECITDPHLPCDDPRILAAGRYLCSVPVPMLAPRMREPARAPHRCCGHSTWTCAPGRPRPTVPPSLPGSWSRSSA